MSSFAPYWALLWSAATIIAVLWLVLKPVYLVKPSTAWPSGLALSYCWCPILGTAGLLISGSIKLQDVGKGLLGDEHVQPYGILILFMSLAYIAASLDSTGIFAWLALKITAASKGNAHLLFFLYFGLSSAMTALTSNDVSIMTLTPIIIYFSRATNTDPMPYLAAEFVAGNLWSMLLFVGNPTNIIVAQAYEMTFLGYTKWMVLPTALAGSLAALQLFMTVRRQLPHHVSLPDIDASGLIKDRVSLWFGCANLGVCLLLLTLAPTLHARMWLICLVCGMVQLAYNAVAAVAMDSDTGRWISWRKILSWRVDMGPLWPAKKYVPSTADEQEADAILGLGLSAWATKPTATQRPSTPTLMTVISSLSMQMYSRRHTSNAGGLPGALDGSASPALSAVYPSGARGGSMSGYHQLKASVTSDEAVGGGDSQHGGACMTRASSGVVPGVSRGARVMSRSKSWGQGLSAARAGAAGARALLQLTSMTGRSASQLGVDVCTAHSVEGGSPRGPGSRHEPGGSGVTSPRVMTLPVMPESPTSSEGSSRGRSRLHAAGLGAAESPRGCSPSRPRSPVWNTRQTSLGSPRRAQPSYLHRMTLLQASDSAVRLLDDDVSSDSMSLTRQTLDSAASSNGGARGRSAPGLIDTKPDAGTAAAGQQQPLPAQPQAAWHANAMSWFRSQSFGSGRGREQGSRLAEAGSEPMCITSDGNAFASHCQLSGESDGLEPAGGLQVASQKLVSVGSDVGLEASHLQGDVQTTLWADAQDSKSIGQQGNAQQQQQLLRQQQAELAGGDVAWIHVPPITTSTQPLQPALPPQLLSCQAQLSEAACDVDTSESAALLPRHAAQSHNPGSGTAAFQVEAGGGDLEAQQGLGQASLQQLMQKQRGFWTVLLHLPWEVVPFVLGMFVLVEGLKVQGWIEYMAHSLGSSSGKGGLGVTLFSMGLLSTALSNVMNNQPMTILFTTVCLHPQFKAAILEHVPAPGATDQADRLTQAALFAVVIGSNVGALFTLIGALAGIMWKNIADRMGVQVTYVAFLKMMMPIGLTTTCVSLVVLWAQFSLVMP